MRVSSAFISALVAFTGSLVAAAPTNVARDPWSPRVLSPNENQGWIIGQTGYVTWDTSNPPAIITGGSSVALVKGGAIVQSGPGSLDQPLAEGFNLLDGHVEFPVPYIEPGDDYQVLLFGSSDNWGPRFSITYCQ